MIYDDDTINEYDEMITVPCVRSFVSIMVMMNISTYDLSYLPFCLCFFIYSWNVHRQAAQNALLDGERQLTVLTRQSVLSRLYPSAQSVMESPTAMESS